MKLIIAIVFCLITVANSSSKRVVIDTTKEIAAFDKVFKEVETLANYNEFDKPESVEKFMIQLDKYTDSLSVMAVAVSSLRYLWSISEHNKLTRSSMLHVLESPLAFRNKTNPNWIEAEKQIFENTSFGISTNNIKSFKKANDDLNRIYELTQKHVNNVNDVLTGKSNRIPWGICDSWSPVSFSAKLIDTYVEEIQPAYRPVDKKFMSELYDRLRSFNDQKGTATRFGQLIMYRAMAAAFVSQFCVDHGTYPVSESATRASTIKIAHKLKGIMKGLSALVMALNELDIGQSVSQTTDGVMKTRWNSMSNEIKNVQGEQQLLLFETRFENIAQVLWENLTVTYGEKANFSVHVVWQNKTHASLGHEYIVYKMHPFSVFVHWTPKLRQTTRVMGQFRRIYKTLNFDKEHCVKDRAADAVQKFSPATDVANGLHQTVRLITDNKVPFVLVAHEIYENYGFNSVYDHTCIPFDVVIGA